MLRRLNKINAVMCFLHYLAYSRHPVSGDVIYSSPTPTIEFKVKLIEFTE